MGLRGHLLALEADEGDDLLEAPPWLLHTHTQMYPELIAHLDVLVSLHSSVGNHSRGSTLATSFIISA